MRFFWTRLSLITLFTLWMLLPLTLEAVVKVYVTNASPQIAVLDADNNTIIKKFTPSFNSTIAESLEGVAISPNQTTAYVVDSGNKGVWIINTKDDTTTNFVPLLTSANPLQALVTPDGSKVYISDTGNGVTQGTIFVLFTADNSVSNFSSITRPAKPSGMALDPTGSRLYVSDATSDTILFVYTTNNDLPLVQISNAVNSIFLAVNRSGIGYNPASSSNEVKVFDTTLNTVTGSIVTTGSNLEGVAFTNDGQTAYVASFGDNTLQVIVGGNPQTPIPLTQPPTQVAINPANNLQVYIAAPTNVNPGTVMVVQNGAQVPNAAYDANLPNASYLAYIVLSPFPPSSLTGKVINNRFVLQTDIVHRLNWGPSMSSDVTSYAVFRNGVQIANVSASGPLVYDDHNRPPKAVDFYEVSAVDANGNLSTPISVSVP